MKKLIALLALLLISTTCFGADTKLGKIGLSKTQIENIPFLASPDGFKGFSVRDGEVIGVSDQLPTSQQVQGAKEWLSALPTQKSQELAASEFDQKTFFGRIVQEFTEERWFELSKSGIGWTMQMLVEYPNFSGLKDYLKGLEADGTLKAEDVKIIKAIFLEQNIDLDAWTA